MLEMANAASAPAAIAGGKEVVKMKPGCMAGQKSIRAAEPVNRCRPPRAQPMFGCRGYRSFGLLAQRELPNGCAVAQDRMQSSCSTRRSCGALHPTRPDVRQCGRYWRARPSCGSRRPSQAPPRRGANRFVAHNLSDFSEGLPRLEAGTAAELNCLPYKYEGARDHSLARSP